MTADGGLPDEVVAALRTRLPDLAARTVAAVTTEVPDYADAFADTRGATIETAVQVALAGFLRLAGQTEGTDAVLGPAREGAYALGRGEARSGRTMAALLAAYRVGARVSWRELSDAVVAADLPAAEVARFAELVFAYIDELSAFSVAGHTDELATSGRVRQQYRERLGSALLAGASADELQAAAERADWPPPATLTVVLLPSARLGDTLPLLDPRTLLVPAELAGPACPDGTTVALVPDVVRAALLQALRARAVTVGPTRPWQRATASYGRVLAAVRSLAPPGDGPLDTETRLLALVLTADPEALADLRAQVLAPLGDLPPATRDRLAETLRSWLLHAGRREAVAADLQVHPQTVRYRLGQLRELYGDRLTDPEDVLALSVALACR